jgi:hypothetical protein
MITRNDATNVRQVQVYTCISTCIRAANCADQKGTGDAVGTFFLRGIQHRNFAGRVPSCDGHGLLHSEST